MKAMPKIMKKILIIILIVVAIVISSLFYIYVFRQFSEMQLDDVTPGIYCEKELLEKADVLMVIPIFNNISIAENKSWCESILELNKTLGMHGVHHNSEEFLSFRNESYVEEGAKEFKKCFGFYPELFEAPHLAFSSENVVIVEKLGLKTRGYFYTATHKVYHCSDTGTFSNKIINWF